MGDAAVGCIFLPAKPRSQTRDLGHPPQICHPDRSEAQWRDLQCASVFQQIQRAPTPNPATSEWVAHVSPLRHGRCSCRPASSYPQNPGLKRETLGHPLYRRESSLANAGASYRRLSFLACALDCVLEKPRFCRCLWGRPQSRCASSSHLRRRPPRRELRAQTQETACRISPGPG